MFKHFQHMKRTKLFSSGFTVLELLVVVAIIGILTAVVFGALGSSRDKGADKAIMENLHGIRTEADLYYTSNKNNYGTVFNSNNVASPASVVKCPVPTSTGTTLFDQLNNPNSKRISSAIAEANTRSGGTIGGSNAFYTNARCFSLGSTWAVAVTLKTDSSKSWCVDSNGAAKQENGDASATGPQSADGGTNSVFAGSALTTGQALCK